MDRSDQTNKTKQKQTTTLWFWGFWGSFAPHLVGKMHHPWFLSSPISQGRQEKRTDLLLYAMIRLPTIHPEGDFSQKSKSSQISPAPTIHNREQKKTSKHLRWANSSRHSNPSKKVLSNCPTFCEFGNQQMRALLVTLFLGLESHGLLEG